LLHDLVELLRRWSQSQRRICYFIFGHHDAICGVQSSGLFSILRLVKSESLVELGDVSTELLNHLNQVDVVDHDVQVVFFVDLTFLLQSLLESAYRVVQELLLVLVLLLDVSVHGDCLHRLVLNILKERVSDSTLQLVVVVDILHYPVNCSFKTLNVTVVLANQHSVALVDLVQFLLLVFKLIYD
jgi:UDP-2,3-diacylglucosamine pyrophosphatase LpxH